MKHDKIFKTPRDKIEPFEFNQRVVNVFDDMIHRSVPLYNETIQRMAGLAKKYYIKGSNIYDLGCSMGNFGIAFLQKMGKKEFSMISVDNSPQMLDEYRKRLSDQPHGKYVRPKLESIENIQLTNASVIVLHLTLQFIPVSVRDAIIQKIYNALVPSGILLITEKVIHKSSALTELQQDFYYNFKKENGYSNLEISQKRDALENVLIPETLEEHTDRFERAGFKDIDVWLKWFNFASFICCK
jgi:tRNA (cmo5U34)-methyltransferase